MLKIIIRKLRCNDKGHAYIGFECTFEITDLFGGVKMSSIIGFGFNFSKYCVSLFLRRAGRNKSIKVLRVLRDLFVFELRKYPAHINNIYQCIVALIQ